MAQQAHFLEYIIQSLLSSLLHAPFCQSEHSCALLGIRFGRKRPASLFHLGSWYSRTAPTPYGDASHVRITSRVLSKLASTLSDVRRSLMPVCSAACVGTWLLLPCMGGRHGKNLRVQRGLVVWCWFSKQGHCRWCKSCSEWGGFCSIHCKPQEVHAGEPQEALALLYLQTRSLESKQHSL